MKIYLAKADTIADYSDMAYAKLTNYRKKKTDKLHVELARLTSITAGLLLNYATKDYLNAGSDEDFGIDSSSVAAADFEATNALKASAGLGAIFQANTAFLESSITEISSDELFDAYDPAYDFEIEELGQGKPVFKERTDLYFNISHTANIVVVVMARKPIGIDIDGNRNFSDRMIDKFYSKKEAQWVYGNELRKSDRFFNIWTMKEAFSKMRGDGIARTILNVEFLHDTDQVECIFNGEKQDVLIEEQEYYGYKIAVIREA
ncbi:4'-phosphopantetheinyl transferase family protein [Lachnospira multipara]|uniref:4'-phosphopantetheinyl transferase superfamily protein n=1 Tax=Lachnospira multipara TaxID=28051 RepID=A0A1H5TR66_9FIRM|nr:4'-phosphopantetheinyl transferase superfamily protein [Lachnospira multipara]SEF64718.1 4'-phosphopantetheinyl transferase superfamily protein [Lachnospira multipara]